MTGDSQITEKAYPAKLVFDNIEASSPWAVNSTWLKLLVGAVTTIIVGLNAWLLLQTFLESLYIT